MALSNLYYVTQDVDSYFVDKNTGLPLANGILTFYRDSQRTVLKNIYTLAGSPPNYTYVQLPNPLTLSSVGTVQDAGGDNVPIYYYPWITDPVTGLLDLDLYYISCTDQNFNQEFTREAWPNLVASTTQTIQNNPLTNQVSNPNFTNVFLNPGMPTVYAVSGSNNIFPIGPDWFISASGTGSITVQQIAVTGNDNIVGNPPYVLDVTVSTGVTTCYLTQIFPANSGLWTSTSTFSVFLSGGFVAQNRSSGTVAVPMFYQESNGVNNTPILIFSGSVTTTYAFLSGSTAAIPQSTNVNSGTAGYVQIYVSIPQSSEIRISAIEVIPSIGAAPTTIPIDLDSSNRNEAYQGDYYIPRLNAKRIPSYLVGWDFPANPFQFGSTPTITTTAAYIVDQTIALKTGGNAVTCARSTVSGGLQITSIPGNTYYLLQYLQGSAVKEMLGTSLSVNVFAYASSLSPVMMNIYLYRAASTSSIPNLTATGTIGTLSGGGIFTLTAAAIANGWTAIPRNNLPTAEATLNVLTTNDQINNPNDYGFSQWQITDATQLGDTDKIAIVVTFSTGGSGAVTTINSISLVPGDLPCRPAIQSTDEVLRQCQYYYQKSFAPGQIPIQNLGFGTGEAIGVQVAAASTSANGPWVKFQTTMRATPTIILYDPNAADAQISGGAGFPWSGSNSFQPNVQGFITAGTTNAVGGLGTQSSVHWSADARLGVV